jgi:molybdopterin molybdotransferase
VVISYEQALETVLAHTPALLPEGVPLGLSLGRVLAEDVRADLDLPPFDRVAMDGYAVRAEDTRHTLVVLDVVARVLAGQVPSRAVGAGEAVSVTTGAPVPPGATAVVPVESTRLLAGGQQVQVTERAAAGAHIAPRGSEARAGDVVLAGGQTIGPAGIAVLAAAGRSCVRVGRRPQVALLVTGDELVDVSASPAPGQIRDANGPALAAAACAAGAELRELGRAPDQPEPLAAAIASGLDTDVLLVSGGVSAGTADLVEAALARNAVEVLFDRVAIKPGAPLVFGRRGATLVFGLPGNPVSAQVTFDLFVRPALLRMQGARVLARPTVEVELLAGAANRSGRQAHLPARVRWERGRLVAQPLPSRGSADVVAHARANALLVLDAGRLRAEAGERATALLLGNFLERDGAA